MTLIDSEQRFPRIYDNETELWKQAPSWIGCPIFTEFCKTELFSIYISSYNSQTVDRLMRPNQAARMDLTSIFCSMDRSDVWVLTNYNVCRPDVCTCICWFSKTSSRHTRWQIIVLILGFFCSYSYSYLLILVQICFYEWHVVIHQSI